MSSSALDVRRFLPLGRAQAFAVHLALSLLVFSGLVFTMLVWWFPGELFFLDGGWQGLKLVAVVDLVLGPALTLILYKPGKPKLAFDLSLIAVIQLAALGYGFVTTYQTRTVALVYADGKFGSVSAQNARKAADDLRRHDIEPQEIESLVEASDQAGATASVPLLMAPDPGENEFGQYLADLLNGLPPLHGRSDRYVVLGDETALPKAHALALESFESAAERSAVEKALADRAVEDRGIELHRFEARYAKGVAIWDPVATRIVDYVPLDDGASDAITTEVSGRDE